MTRAANPLDNVSVRQWQERRVARHQLEAIAVQLIVGAGVRLDPPVDLRALAVALGAAEVRIDDLGQLHKGHTRVEGREIVVTLSSRLSPQRQRFVLAHEVAHLVLALPELRVSDLRRRAGLFDDEQFCNSLAACLLLPAPWIRSHRGPRDLATLIAISSRAQASASATLLRLRDVNGWRLSMMQWRRTAGAWQSSTTVAIPRPLRSRIVTSSAVASCLDALPSGSRQPSRTILPIGDGALSRVEADVHRRRNSVLALVDLRPALYEERDRLRPKARRSRAFAGSSTVPSRPRAADAEPR
jgi:hypothetical protein